MHLEQANMSTTRQYVLHIHYILLSLHSFLYQEGSSGQVVKVSASQPRGHGFLNPEGMCFEPYNMVTTMLPHMTPVLAGSRLQTL